MIGIIRNIDGRIEILEELEDGISILKALRKCAIYINDSKKKGSIYISEIMDDNVKRI